MMDFRKFRSGVRDVGNAAQRVGSDIRTQTLMQSDLTSAQRNGLVQVIEDLNQLNRLTAIAIQKLDGIEASMQESQSDSTRQLVDRWKTT